MIGALGALIGGMILLGRGYALYEWHVSPKIAKFVAGWDNVKSGISIASAVR